MTLTVPELALVVLVVVSGSGNSTFARRHFKPTEILSSDACRAMASDDENNQAATPDAFELPHFIARKRLAAGKLAVVDATNVQPESRIAFKQGEVKHVYFVAETKGTLSSLQLRRIEECKIDCARKFFTKITSDRVKYDVVDSYGKLMELVK